MLIIENPEHEEKIVSVNNQKLNNQKKKWNSEPDNERLSWFSQW
jgi:hypothetical protein